MLLLLRTERVAAPLAADVCEAALTAERGRAEGQAGSFGFIMIMH